jgi:hypothetical protein
LALALKLKTLLLATIVAPVIAPDFNTTHAAEIKVMAAPSVDKLISARPLLSFRSDNVDSTPTPICHSTW